MGASTVAKRLPERSPGLRWRNAARGERVRRTMILASLLLPSDFLLTTDPNSKLMGKEAQMIAEVTIQCPTEQG